MGRLIIENGDTLKHIENKTESMSKKLDGAIQHTEYAIEKMENDMNEIKDITKESHAVHNKMMNTLNKTGIILKVSFWLSLILAVIVWIMVFIIFI